MEKIQVKLIIVFPHFFFQQFQLFAQNTSDAPNEGFFPTFLTFFNFIVQGQEREQLHKHLLLNAVVRKLRLH